MGALKRLKMINKNKSEIKSTDKQFGVLTYIITNISKHRGRTILTIIGIAVPIAFFVLFSAMGSGLEQYVDSQSTNLNKERYNEISRIVNSWTSVLLVIIAIMIITSITNTILMSTSERRFELGVLKALGIKSDQILNLVLFEAFIISFIASIVGIIIGTWGAIIFDYMFWLDEGSGFFFAPAKITIGSIILAIVLTLFVGTITAVYPALAASRVNTIDILRTE